MCGGIISIILTAVSNVEKSFELQQENVGLLKVLIQEVRGLKEAIMQRYLYFLKNVGIIVWFKDIRARNESTCSVNDVVFTVRSALCSATV